MGINWRERLIAAAVHFIVTLALTGAAAAIIFLVWFPGSLATMVGGTKLFLIVVGCDAGLGPLISLVIYSSAKARKELLVDYTIVGAVQLAALLYGVYVVALSRPVFIAFDVDRFEIVTAIEVGDAELSEGNAPEFRTKSWLGPQLVAIDRPTDPKAKSDLLFLEVSGKRAAFMPKYYRPYDTAKDKIQSAIQPVTALDSQTGEVKSKIDSAVSASKKTKDELGWLLMRHRFGFGTALIDKTSMQPVGYVAIDPT